MGSETADPGALEYEILLPLRRERLQGAKPGPRSGATEQIPDRLMADALLSQIYYGREVFAITKESGQKDLTCMIENREISRLLC